MTHFVPCWVPSCSTNMDRAFCKNWSSKTSQSGSMSVDICGRFQVSPNSLSNCLRSTPKRKRDGPGPFLFVNQKVIPTFCDRTRTSLALCAPLGPSGPRAGPLWTPSARDPRTGGAGGQRPGELAEVGGPGRRLRARARGGMPWAATAWG